ncbi:alanine racemase C-terminal domain-containing protein, partial [Metapseudomonas otitidis]|uniref:alanine racemase C-terminal domain-containing protein n=1 Tax=Metapseudomonas otitidis TaxID=319939 RepID=UPI0028123B3E
RGGVVAMGYADGYPRHAPTGTPVAIDGQPSRLIGRVSMDMLTVDLTDLPHAGLGSRVELWGNQVSAAEVAMHAGTIPYQIFCNLRRVPLSER